MELNPFETAMKTQIPIFDEYVKWSPMYMASRTDGMLWETWWRICTLVFISILLQCPSNNVVFAFNTSGVYILLDTSTWMHGLETCLKQKMMHPCEFCVLYIYTPQPTFKLEHINMLKSSLWTQLWLSSSPNTIWFNTLHKIWRFAHLIQGPRR